MTAQHNMLLAIIGGALTGKMPEIAGEDCDWQQVVEEAQLQTVSLILLDALAPYEAVLPKQAYETATTYGMNALSANMKVGYSQKELVGILDGDGWDYVILKGESAAAYYPKPELRTLGDVDFLIDPRQKAQIGSLLESKGYKRYLETHACHEVYRKPGAHLEMHFRVVGLPGGKRGEEAEGYLAEALKEREEKDVGSGKFRAPADHHHGLVLLLHMQYHMLSEGLGLRHLCDWASFVHSTWQKPFWQKSLLPLLRRIGLMTYAAVMTRTAALYLGTACPDWAQADADLCQGVMEDIMSGGNFGKKDESRTASGQMISNRGQDGTRHSKLYYLRKSLQIVIFEQHPQLKHQPVRLELYTLWRAGRYGVRMLLGKRPDLRRVSAEADARKSVYDRLHIFE